MAGHGKHRAEHGRDRAVQERKKGAHDHRRRRAVDPTAPVAEGLTSPGEGADDAPSQARQSKDYA